MKWFIINNYLIIYALTQKLVQFHYFFQKIPEFKIIHFYLSSVLHQLMYLVQVTCTIN